MAEALAAEGWTILVARLAGHGTSPRDLARATWHDWVASAREAYVGLQQRCRRIAIVGLSMGGALALYLAAWERPSAVAVISTPVRLRPFMAAASRAASRVLPLAPVVVRLSPREREMRRYRSPYSMVPLGAASEVERLLHAMREALPGLRVPVLVVQGRRDWVIPPESGRQIVALARSAPARLLWLPHSGHVATLDRDRAMLFDEVRAFLRAHLGAG